MAPIKCWQVDAFTDRPFAGNPAAVCWLEENEPDHWMQAVAGEINLSETAFVTRHDDGYDLRWFTLTTEVDLCGHATLASAHTLWTEGLHPLHAHRDDPTRFMLDNADLRHGKLFTAYEAKPVNTPNDPADKPSLMYSGNADEVTSFHIDLFDKSVWVQDRG